VYLLYFLFFTVPVRSEEVSGYDDYMYTYCGTKLTYLAIEKYGQNINVWRRIVFVYLGAYLYALYTLTNRDTLIAHQFIEIVYVYTRIYIYIR